MILRRLTKFVPKSQLSIVLSAVNLIRTAEAVRGQALTADIRVPERMASRKKAIQKAKKGKPIRQVAAVPFRIRDGGVEVMLVTSRTTKRFIIPKGWPMKGKSGREAARIEAREEAGVGGTVLARPLGGYSYWKRLTSAFVPIRVTVYLLEVDDILAAWDESSRRERAWLAPADAATLVDEPELATLIRTVDAAVAAAQSRAVAPE